MNRCAVLDDDAVPLPIIAVGSEGKRAISIDHRHVPLGEVEAAHGVTPVCVRRSVLLFDWVSRHSRSRFGVLLAPRRRMTLWKLFTEISRLGRWNLVPGFGCISAPHAWRWCPGHRGSLASAALA